MQFYCAGKWKAGGVVVLCSTVVQEHAGFSNRNVTLLRR